MIRVSFGIIKRKHIKVDYIIEIQAKSIEAVKHELLGYLGIHLLDAEYFVLLDKSMKVDTADVRRLKPIASTYVDKYAAVSNTGYFLGIVKISPKDVNNDEHCFKLLDYYIKEMGI